MIQQELKEDISKEDQTKHLQLTVHNKFSEPRYR